MGNGLNKISPFKFKTFTIRDGLSGNTVYCLYQDSRGDLWFGTVTGLNRWSASGSEKRVFTTADGLSGNTVYSIYEDSDKNLWFGTMGNGLNRYDPKTRRFTAYTPDSHGLPSGLVHAIHQDARGVLWIGTAEGLARFDNNRFTVYTTCHGMSDHFVRYITHDRDNTLWVATDRGGLVYFKNNSFRSFNTRNGLSDNRAMVIHIDKNNVLWVGTFKGLNRIENGNITTYSRQDGLFSEIIPQLLEDDTHLWVGSTSGVFRVVKQELEDFANGKTDAVHSISYDESDGLKSLICLGGCQPAQFKARDGRLWFATLNGASVLEPATLTVNSRPPTVIIEKLHINGEPVKINPKPGEKESVMLSPGKKRMEFFYTALGLQNPVKAQFMYRIAGYDDEWIDAGTERSATYTNLPPGRYTFHLSAVNEDGIRGDTTMDFYLKPWFYQTTWFYIVAILSIMLAVFTFYRIRVRQLKRREKELGRLVEEQTVELTEQAHKLKELDRMKSRFFANISHEFRTPLTLIMGPLEQMLEGELEKDKEETIDIALRNSRRLLALINQLLDLSRLESGRTPLQAVQKDVIPFLKGLIGSFQSLVKQKNLHLSFQTGETEIYLWFDPVKLEKVIVNLISNAVKFTPAGGSIAMAAGTGQNPVQQYPDGYLQVILTDSGIGIPAQQLPFIFDRFYQAGQEFSHMHKQKGSGIGLALVRELVNLHGGEITVSSNNGESKSSGTQFTLRLPLGNNHLKPEDISPNDIHSPDVEAVNTIKDELSLQTNPGNTPSGNGNIKEGKKQGKGDNKKKEEKNEEEKKDEDKNGNVILVVEDNPDVRRFIRGPLEPEYRIMEAGDGEEGIKTALKIIPDLIISDVMMPKKDGYQLCDALKKDIKTSHIPIILLTAKASEASVVEGLETGADDYITKPFNTKILLTRIRNLIDLRRNLQETVQREMMLRPTEIAVSSMDREFMKQLKTVLDKYTPDSEFGVDQLASLLYMSRATLNRKIKALTGESTNQFIQSYRLKRAAQLLKADFGNVTDVAFEVGFSSTAYFTKCFKDQFHQLPHNYKASESA